MDCLTIQLAFIGVGVRLAHYVQATALIILLWRGSISAAAATAELCFVFFLAVFAAGIVHIVDKTAEDGLFIIPGKQMVPIFHMFLFHISAFVAVRAAKEMQYWRVWYVNFLRWNSHDAAQDPSALHEDETEVKTARRRYIWFATLTFIPSCAISVAFIAYWGHVVTDPLCDHLHDTGSGFLFYPVPADGWIRWVYVVISSLSVIGTGFALVYLNNIKSFSEKFRPVASSWLNRASAETEKHATEVVARYSTVDAINEGAAAHFVKHCRNWSTAPKLLAFRLLFLMVLNAIAVEMTMLWNVDSVTVLAIGDKNGLRSYSQLFPLCVAVCVLFQALLPQQVEVSSKEMYELLARDIPGAQSITDDVHHNAATPSSPRQGSEKDSEEQFPPQGVRMGPVPGLGRGGIKDGRTLPQHEQRVKDPYVNSPMQGPYVNSPRINGSQMDAYSPRVHEMNQGRGGPVPSRMSDAYGMPPQRVGPRDDAYRARHPYDESPRSADAREDMRQMRDAYGPYYPRDDMRQVADAYDPSNRGFPSRRMASRDEGSGMREPQGAPFRAESHRSGSDGAYWQDSLGSGRQLSNDSFRSRFSGAAGSIPK